MTPGDVWALWQQNASPLEIKWTISCALTLAAALIRVGAFGRLFWKLFHRDGEYHRERRMATLRVLRYLERSYVLGIFVFIGFLAMSVPAPIRLENTLAAEQTGNLFLSGAFAMLLFSVVEEIIERHI